MSAKPETLARTVVVRSGTLKRSKGNTNEGLEAAARLLTDWGLESLHSVFRDHEIDVDCFKVMIMDDINELIPAENLGMRIKFRKRLLEWRHVNNVPIPIAETSTNRSVISWLLSQIGGPSNHGGAPVQTDSVSAYTAKPSDQMPSSSKDITIDLESLLNQSVMGKNIIAEYQKNSILSQNSRNDLCTLIADHWLAFSYQNILRKHYSDAASEIVRLFPKESKETYISSGTRKQGKLVQRLYNLSRKYREKGLVESRKHKTLTDEGNGQDAKRRCLAAQQNPVLIASKVWLRSVTVLETFVLKQWAETRDLRLATTGVSEMMKEWPIILQSFGASLIEMDFDQMHPTRDKLALKFPEFAEKIKQIYWRDIKDESSKALLARLGSATNSSSEQYILLTLLASVLVPPLIQKSNDSKAWKPTILDAQNLMFIHLEHLESLSNIRTAVIDRRLFLMKKGLATQPLIVVIGAATSLAKFYISCFGKLYEFNNFLKTVAVAFKMYNVIKFEYPKPCKQVWEFIQCYFFDLPVAGKRTNALNALLAELKELPQSAT